MGSLGEEDLEKLVIDYIESPIIVASDDVEEPSKVLITLQVYYIYSHPSFNAFSISRFCIKLNRYIYRIFLGQKEKKRRRLKRR